MPCPEKSSVKQSTDYMVSEIMHPSKTKVEEPCAYICNAANRCFDMSKTCTY